MDKTQKRSHTLSNAALEEKWFAGQAMTTRQAAEFLGLSYSTLCKWRMFGYGPPFVQVGERRIVYRISDLKEWMSTKLYRSTSEYWDQ